MNDLFQPAPVALSNLSLPQLIDTLPREEAKRITTPSPIASGQSSPLYGHAISAGFPSPADDYVESKLDLNQLLVRNKAATFFLRVKGDSMTGAGIHDGDIIVVDRSITPADRSVVVAVIDGELTVKRLLIKQGVAELHAENPQYAPLRFQQDQELTIWGVVTSAVHTVK